MRGAFAVVIIAATVAAGLSVGAQGAHLQIYATVLNDQGGSVRGLQAADLVLRDGGVRQGTIDVQPATDPLSVAIVVQGFSPDDVGLLRTALEAAARALRAQNSGTQIGLVGPGPSATMIGPGGGLPALDAALTAPAAPTFVDAVLAGCQVLSAAPPDRRVVLGLVKTHGVTDVPHPERLAASVSANQVSLWTVELGASGPADWSPAVDAALTEAVRLGGSLRHPAKSAGEVAGGIAAIIDDLTAQYVVTYAWPDPMLSEFNLVTRHEAGKVLTPAWPR
jgi:hypothetical protein